MKIRSMNRKQTGASLMEVLVAMSISLVVTASMIALMVNSLSSTARIIQMTKLSDDMRVALQMMSRDVRRSSYNVNSMRCYANENCNTDSSLVAVGDITINGSNDCLVFLTDREHDDYDSTMSAGGFRRAMVDLDDDGTADVGVIEMWTGSGDPAGICDDEPGAAGWVEVTDPKSTDIFAFSIDDDLSYTQVVKDDGAGNTVSQRVRKVRMALQGRLVFDGTIQRQMGDVISVRNDLLL
jgi:hypothetical protein